MEFVDQYLSDGCANIVEEMVNLHVSKDYENVRNIILGYDSKKGVWISKYGESLVKRGIIMAGRTIVNRSFSGSTEDFFKNSGMIFYDDEVSDTIRIYIDDASKRILDVMFTVSKNVIEYRHIIDIIVTEWNMKNAVGLYKNGIDIDICGELHFFPIEVKEDTWKEFKSVAKHKGLTVRDSFKLAIINFLENRAEILKHKQ